MSDNARRLSPSSSLFAKNSSIPYEVISKLEGHDEGSSDKRLSVKPLIVGETMLFMEAKRPQGLVDPEHAHPDHESICYLVSGRVRVVIEGRKLDRRTGRCMGSPRRRQALPRSARRLRADRNQIPTNKNLELDQHVCIIQIAGCDAQNVDRVAVCNLNDGAKRVVAGDR